MTDLRAALANARRLDRTVTEPARQPEALQVAPHRGSLPDPPPITPARRTPVDPTGATDAANARPPSVEEVLAMSCTEFAKANLVLLIRSALLGDDIVLASDETSAARAGREHAVFLAEEILRLYGTGRLDVEALKVAHRTKKGLGDARLAGIDRFRRQ